MVLYSGTDTIATCKGIEILLQACDITSDMQTLYVGYSYHQKSTSKAMSLHKDSRAWLFMLHSFRATMSGRIIATTIPLVLRLWYMATSCLIRFDFERSRCATELCR